MDLIHQNPAELLWMDEILHHLRNPGMMNPLQIPMNNDVPWFPSGAGFRPSTVSTEGLHELDGTLPQNLEQDCGALLGLYLVVLSGCLELRAFGRVQMPTSFDNL